MKRIRDAGHVREGEAIRIGQGERGESFGSLPGLPEQLGPLETSRPSLPVQVRDDLGSDASAGRRDLAVKRREQAHHASEARACRAVREHPSKVPGLHPCGTRQVGERHPPFGGARPDRRHQLHPCHRLNLLRRRARRYAQHPASPRP
ncbi:MAG: hypothetical protein JNL82_37290 [Myxococcales bacterium]|nr:hypothetical protein [Myxococcales bacterium]